jgi:predicted RNA-binding Zn-ribbon protein involved in translation (DUF1610 family)
VRVIANNNAGIIVAQTAGISLIKNYMLSVDILTAPASASGAYTAGQELKVSFTITKMSSELANVSLVYAEVWLETLVGGDYICTGEVGYFTGMSGELTIVLPAELADNIYAVGVETDLTDDSLTMVTVSSNAGGFASNVGGNMSMTDLILAIMMVVVILMLLWQMIKGRAAAAGAGADKKPAEPKAKEESYAPKATVNCASCSSPIEVATSKRPIEVMCPKCGKSQMVN